MILVVDNYDSFTFNLVQLLGELGEDPLVVRNDTLSVEACLDLGPRALVISPGPGTPDRAGVSEELVRRLDGRIPILGVCLGHQCLATAFGGQIVRASTPCHGQAREIEHDGRGLFGGIPSPCEVALYHSLMVQETSLDNRFQVTARARDGTIMAVAGRERPTFGIQFHPESFMTPNGREMVYNFISFGVS